MEFNFVPDMPELTFSMFIAPYRAHLMGFYIVVTPPACPWTINCPIGRFLLAIKQCRIYPRDTPPLPFPRKKKHRLSVTSIEINVEFLWIFFSFFFFFFLYKMRQIGFLNKDYGFDSTKINYVSILIWILIIIYLILLYRIRVYFTISTV